MRTAHGARRTAHGARRTAHGGWRSACALTVAVISGFAADRAAMAQCNTCDNPSIRFVRPGGDDSCSGQCWGEAYRTLNRALEALNEFNSVVTEIRLAGFDGSNGGVIYRLSDSTIGFSTNGSFVISKAVTIEGGYRGVTDGGGDADNRDLCEYETILSGDIASDDDPGDPATLEDNAHHVIRFVQLSDPGVSRIDGVTIEAGYAVLDPESSESDRRFGGGMLVHEQYIAGLKFVVKDCLFRGNRATFGGGAIAARSELIFVPVELELRRCIFEGNTLESHPDGVSGLPFISLAGGAAIATDGPLLVVRCRFEGNKALSIARGGAIAVTSSFTSSNPLLRVVNSHFTANEATPEASYEDGYGGAIYAWNVIGTIDLTGCVLAGNEASNQFGAGGALWVGGSSTDTAIRNCTIANNQAGGVGGGVCLRSGAIENSILFSNTAGNGSTFAQQIEGSTSIAYSCVEGIDTGVYTQNNTGANPVFAAAMSGDYRLTLSSPLIERGDNGRIPKDVLDVNDNSITTGEDLPWDLDRRSRVAACKVDIGAYELGDCIGDLTGDGQVSGADLALVLGNWLGTGQGDLTCDTIVDGADIAVILGNWGPCSGLTPGTCLENAAEAMMMSMGGSQSSMSGDPETTAPDEAGGDSIPSGAIVPEVIFEAFGFESVEEFVQWLSSLDFETMKSMLESLFGN